MTEPPSPPPLGVPSVPHGPDAGGGKTIGFFDRYLTVWVAVCMVVGVAVGRVFPGLTDTLRSWEFRPDSHVNIPIAILIWLMIIPMMAKIDFTSLVGVTARPRGLVVTLVVNWLLKPLSMFALGWLFFSVIFARFISAELAQQYTAGVIILGAAPCTAMVFVWSHLSDGDPAYTLVQVAVNDLVMLVLFAPIVGVLVGVSGLVVPYNVLALAVGVFIVVPLAVGAILRGALIARFGSAWFETAFLPRLQPVTTVALLATLVTIFAFQANNILSHPGHVALIAVPLLVQVYAIWAIGYGLMRLLGVPYEIAAPGSLVGASNFFELAVATAIALYGPDSGAALATVVGVLVEVPVMLSLCGACHRTRHWFDQAVTPAAGLPAR